jgi:ribonuclease R
VPRACLAVRMTVTEDGTLKTHRFVRGLMRSRASLEYSEVQAAQDGAPSERTEGLVQDIIAPLYAAHDALRRAREARQPLDLDLPERRIELTEEGRVSSVAFKDRLDAHRMIEEFMVLANVAAARELAARRTPLLYRVHEEPQPEKIEALRETAEAAGFTLAKGQVLKTAQLNRLLRQAEGTEHDELINMSTLRSMTQAYYSPENFGHFGLALTQYAHFTSPIRRYSDLIVHRALIAAHGWGNDGLKPEEIERLEETAKHISDTERRSMAAERDTTDRYLAAFLSDRVGATFTGRISGIARFGAFVKLDEPGADGLLPMRALGHEYFHYDADSQSLMGAESGLVIAIGDKVEVRLAEAVPVTGGLTLELVGFENKEMPKRAGRGRPGTSPRRKAGKSAKKRVKLRKKAARRG